MQVKIKIMKQDQEDTQTNSSCTRCLDICLGPNLEMRLDVVYRQPVDIHQLKDPLGSGLIWPPQRVDRGHKAVVQLGRPPQAGLGVPSPSVASCRTKNSIRSGIS